LGAEDAVTPRRPWTEAIVAAGAVRASYVPEASIGRSAALEPTGAELVEGEALAVHPVPVSAAGPSVVSFLDGIQQWAVVGYDGVTPIVRAYVAAAVRRREPDRRLRTAGEAAREFAITRLAALSASVRRALEADGVEIVDLTADETGQPGTALRAAHLRVDRGREEVERELGERAAARLGSDEWLVVDGLLSESRILAEHPRALGVIKSHGAQYFEGAALERALTLPAEHRTSAFRPLGHQHRPVYSWYLRLWPWEGNDLLYGLLRIEARAHGASVAQAATLSGWLLRERAPVSTPDARWDRLLYPIHDVETYLRARAPRGLFPPPGSRLPKTGT
jgi:hypothetical protein